MKKQSIAIIGVIAFVLAVAVGYALFSETLTVTGTAKAKGSFDYEFTKVGDIDSVGYTKQTTDPAHELTVISDDKNTLTITVNKLDYPGSYVEIPVTVTNVGTIKGKLLSIEETDIWNSETGEDTTSSVLEVTYKGIAKDEVVAPGETQNFTVRVEWPESHKLAADANEFEEEVSFTLGLNYEQVND